MALKRFFLGFIQNATMAELPYVPLEQLTHIVYTHMNPASATDVTLIGGFEFNLTACVAAGHAKGIKVLISLFINSNILVGIAQNGLLDDLADKVADVLIAHNADGVDINLEPWVGPAQVVATDELITALYAVLNPLGKIITFEGYAAMPQQGQPLPVINVSLSSVPKLAAINLMAYDLAYPAHSTYEDSVASLNGWVAAGFPPSKIALGFPSYARDADGAVATYADVVRVLNPAPDQNEATIDSITGFWGLQVVHGRKLWWNSPELARKKARFIKDGGFLGMMLYEVGQDARGPLSLIGTVYNEFNQPAPIFLASMGVLGLLALVILVSKKKGA